MAETNSVECTREMMADLEEYYETAGFTDFHERVLKNMDPDQIRKYHHDTFEVEDDHEFEEWERSLNDEE